MKFQLIGVNHKTAPVEVRERLAIPESRLPEALRRLAAHPGVEEGIILSTCNRVEVLTQTKNGAVDLRGFLRDYFQLNPSDYEPHLYEYRESEAVRHLFRVTSSLDSMVVGEPQILGQVKEAYATARAVGVVHSQLRSAAHPGVRGGQAGTNRNGRGIVCSFGRFGRGRTGQEDLRIAAGQARLSGGRGQDERTGGTPPAGPRCGIHFCGQPHLRSRPATGGAVRWPGHSV